MSEFCSQSHAPIAAIGKKRTMDKRFQPCGYPARNRNGVIQLDRRRPKEPLRTSKDRAKRKSMAHRSNQAVASQDRELTQLPDDPPPPRRLLAGWAMALAALGLSSLLLAVGLWFVRYSIAAFMIGAALAERGRGGGFPSH